MFPSRWAWDVIEASASANVGHGIRSPNVERARDPFSDLVDAKSMRHVNAGAPVTPGFMIGRVSMDMVTVDVTDVPVVAVGDPVLLWGSGEVPVEEIAQLAGAIPYELVCGVSQRVPIEMA